MLKGTNEVGDTARGGGLRTSTAKGTLRQESPIDLLQDLEDKIILKYRRRINQLERKFADDMV